MCIHLCYWKLTFCPMTTSKVKSKEGKVDEGLSYRSHKPTLFKHVSLEAMSAARPAIPTFALVSRTFLGTSAYNVYHMQNHVIACDRVWQQKYSKF